MEYKYLQNLGMISGLLKNKSVERVLFFLLVNEKCYASQLSRLFALSLTPLQKGLDHLEKIGVVRSAFEGKTRFYVFNTSYPLLAELEAFLKKAYSLLSLNEKRIFYYIKQQTLPIRKEGAFLLYKSWEQLQKISHIRFTSIMRFGRSEHRVVGEGEVLSNYDDKKGTVVFSEKGNWKNAQGEAYQFRNVFRWSLNRLDGLLSLEHLRFGVKNPVFLFHLAPAAETVFESVHAHLCGQDTYFGQLHHHPNSLELIWRILGPKKNEEIRYIYS